VWWLTQSERLSRRAAKAIAEAQTREAIVVSCFSTWELALLVQRGRVALALDLLEWLREAERVPGVRFEPVTNAIAYQSVVLPGEFHADPAGQIIVATARSLAATLVTGDRKIRDYSHTKTFW
jgi:PIN domain nuclease of toxin-antitoxin system